MQNNTSRQHNDNMRSQSRPSNQSRVPHPSAKRNPTQQSKKQNVVKKPFEGVENDRGENFTLGNRLTPSEKRVSKAIIRQRTNYRDVKVKRKPEIPFVTIFFMLICTLLVMFMIINFVQINEMNHEVAKMKETAEELQEQKRELTLELEEKNDQREIESYASDLGMISQDQLRRVYIDIENEDKIDNYEEDNEDRGVIATVLNALGENMRTYWNIFIKSE